MREPSDGERCVFVITVRVRDRVSGLDEKLAAQFVTAHSLGEALQLARGIPVSEWLTLDDRDDPAAE